MFSIVDISKSTPEQRLKPMESLIFLNANIDNYIKRRMVYNRNPTIEWISREDAAIPNASFKSLMPEYFPIQRGT